MNYKLEGFCEIDEFAKDSYCAIHNVSYLENLVDVTKINTHCLGPVTMVCGGSPCQDFSVAGKGKGNTYTCGDCGHEWNPLTVHYSERNRCPRCGCYRIDGTRSSLVCHFLRIVRGTKPKFGLFENVKALTNKKHRDTFELFLKELQEYGYDTYWKVLNAKDFGIPQNRERVIVVFVRKDVDNGMFRFPEPIGCDNPVLALMDEDVPESFYITGEKVERFLEKYFGKDDYKESGFCGSYYGEKHHSGYSGAVWDGTSRTIKANYGKTSLASFKRKPDMRLNSSQDGKAVDGTGVVPTHSAGHGNQPKVLVQSGYLHNNADSNRVYDSNGVSRTIKAEAGGGGAKTGWYLINPERDGTSRTIKANYGKTSFCRVAIRKLTPKECFRLMGFDDADYEAAKAAGISNSQLYKQAGNSIVVDMLYYVLKSLRAAIPELFDDLTLLSLFSGIGAFEKALDKLGGPMEHDWDWEAWERMQDCCSDGFAASMRNGNRHTPGAKSEQRIESEGKREMNTVSTVEKDCLLFVKKKKY